MPISNRVCGSRNSGGMFQPRYVQFSEETWRTPERFATDDAVLYALKLHLEELHAAGVRILLDDFGEGYTSFDDLQNYPVDMIKIGKSLIDNLSTAIGVRIFESVLHIAENLHVRVVCEGVETSEQLDILRKHACRYVQGFYFYRPMNSDQFERVIGNTAMKKGEGQQ